MNPGAAAKMLLAGVVLAVLCAVALPVIAIIAGGAGMASGAVVVDANSASGGQLNVDALPAAARGWAVWIIQAGSTCSGITPPDIAAQVDQESGWNPNAVAHNPASAGGDAMGLAQFQAGTFATWGTDADSNGSASPYDPPDAVMAQGRLMCDLVSWATTNLTDHKLAGDAFSLALAAYECGRGCVLAAGGVPAAGVAHDYPAAVEAKVAKYTLAAITVPAGGTHGIPAGFKLPPGTPTAIVTAIDWAFAQLGTPYHLNGSCTNSHSGNPAYECDCSSLVQQSYKAGGVTLPRTAAEQSRTGKTVTPSQLLPGDLIFIPGSDGTKADPGHVGMYIGQGLIVEAPHTGDVVKIASYGSRSDWVNDLSGIRREVKWS